MKEFPDLDDVLNVSNLEIEIPLSGTSHSKSDNSSTTFEKTGKSSISPGFSPIHSKNPSTSKKMEKSSVSRGYYIEFCIYYAILKFICSLRVNFGKFFFKIKN